MLKTVTTLLLIFSFLVSLMAGDSCCTEIHDLKQTVSPSTDCNSEVPGGFLPGCLSCTRCGNVLHFSRPLSCVESEIRVASYLSYSPSQAPFPELSRFLRPPIET